MLKKITEEQAGHYKEFKIFAKEHIIPAANEWDRKEALSPEIFSELKSRGYLGARVAREYGGKGWDYVTYGLLNEACGYASVSLCGLLNVHTMIAMSIEQWGSEEQKEKWLPRMASGEIIGALAITEPGAGSDIEKIQTEYSIEDDRVYLNGIKRWITCGAIADVIMVIGRLDGAPVACLVEKKTPGFTVSPLKNMLGFKASHLAILDFKKCEIKKENIVGKPGFAFSHIVPFALDIGRVSVAFSALGLLRACFEAAGTHSLQRETFKSRLLHHGAIAERITRMGVDLKAARSLCIEACQSKDNKDIDAYENVLAAKYFTTRAATRHAVEAVQIHGASGCNEDLAIARYYRDAKAMEIIEGSNQILEKLLSMKYARKGKWDFTENNSSTRKAGSM